MVNRQGQRYAHIKQKRNTIMTLFGIAGQVWLPFLSMPITTINLFILAEILLKLSPADTVVANSLVLDNNYSTVFYVLSFLVTLRQIRIGKIDFQFHFRRTLRALTLLQRVLYRN